MSYVRRDKHPRDDDARSQEAFMRLVGALIKSVEHIDNPAVQFYLRAIASQLREDSNLPKDPLLVEEKLDDFVRIIGEFKNRGGDLKALQAALRVRAKVRSGE